MHVEAFADGRREHGGGVEATGKEQDGGSHGEN
jgi:hypothetical protein